MDVQEGDAAEKEEEEEMPMEAQQQSGSGVTLGTPVAASNKSGTALGSCFNIINSAVGAGVLALPHAFQQSGLIGGSFTLVLAALFETLSLFILISTTDKRQASSYQGLVKATLGSVAQKLIAVSCTLYLFGACVGYLIVIGDTITPILHQHFSSFGKDALRKICIAISSATICFPLSLSRRISALEVISGVVPAAVAYVVGLVVYRGTTNLSSPSSLYFGSKPFLSIPVMVLAFQCHIQIVPIFTELGVTSPTIHAREEEIGLLEGDKQSSLRARKRKRRIMAFCTIYSILFCFILYGVIGVFGYLQFGNDTESNIIKNYKHGGVDIDIGRIGIAITAIVSYPVNLFPARSAILDILQALFSKSMSPTLRSWMPSVVTLCFYLGTVSIALYVTNLGTVYEIVGATVGVTVIFIIPGILLMKGYASSAEEKRYSTHKNAGCALILVGCLITISSILTFAQII